MYDARTKLADQVEAEVREYFGPRVYQTVVPRTVRLSEAPSFGQPIGDLLRGADFLPVFNQPQRESLAMLFLGVRRYGYDVGWIFGLWLFHFGVCVWKSGFLPRLLGALLIAACFGYLSVSLTTFLLPSYVNIVSRLANIPLTLGEPAAILWLLIRGAKDQPLEAGA